MESWKCGDVRFYALPQALVGVRKEQAKWMFEDAELLALTFQKLSGYTHARPDGSYGVLWQSNGPVYKNAAIKLTFLASLSVHALCYLLIRLARPCFVMPEGSDILFELDWMPDYAPLVRAYTDLYGKPPQPPLRD